ncbi:MAG: hypothetical protein FWF52_03530 [Candidatus Azobacteroides sp.]|nr:hypothetical protein [Candidatus Azobacteroides sp.]
MKHLIQYIVLSIVLLFTFSCSNDFLKESVDYNSYLGENSIIVVSPNWAAQDYTLYCSGVGNAKFTVVHAPEWLNISAQSGEFINNIATLNCKANACSAFSAVGVYDTYMTLSVAGTGNVVIPILYITEGNPVIETSNSLMISYDYGGSYNGILSIKNAGQGILLWNILEYPQWLIVSNNNGMMYGYSSILPYNAEETVYVTFDPNVPFQEGLSGKLVIGSNDKNKPEVEVEIQMDLGNPAFYSYFVPTLDFGRTETTLPFEFSNQGNGILAWTIEGCPEWLSVSRTSGYSYPYSWDNLTFTCNRGLVPSGVNTITIYLKTNDKDNLSLPIAVTASNYVANSNDVKAIEGNVTDVRLDRQSDILYFTTSQPNRFVAYDIKNRTIAREISLNYAPTCFSLSEDGRNAVIGHSGYVSSIDMDRFSVTKTIEVNHIVSDIEWAKDGWCCYTENSMQWSYLYWINLNTNEASENGSLYGGCMLRKMPNQDYIMASEVNLSSGVYIFDISTRNKKYDDFIYVGNFWFSEKGTYLFSGENIYRTSSFFTQDYSSISPIGRFSPAPNRVFWVDHHEAKHNVWILSSPSDYYSDENPRNILQYEDNDYTRKAVYCFDNLYGSRLVQAQYVFANNAGTELVVLRNAIYDVMWSLEFVPITQ